MDSESRIDPGMYPFSAFSSYLTPMPLCQFRWSIAWSLLRRFSLLPPSLKDNQNRTARPARVLVLLEDARSRGAIVYKYGHFLRVPVPLQWARGWCSNVEMCQGWSRHRVIPTTWCSCIMIINRFYYDNCIIIILLWYYIIRYQQASFYLIDVCDIREKGW